MSILTKKEIIEKYNLSSAFVSITKTKEVGRDFKNQFYTLTPKYSVSVNGEDFFYNQSQMFLGQCFGLKQPLYFCDNEIYVGITTNKRDLYNRVKTSFSVSFNSVLDIQKSLKKEFTTLNENDLLFAFRCILQDAMIKFECDDYFDFLECFGYGASRASHSIYNSCIDTSLKLKFNESKINEILENLSALEIE